MALPATWEDFTASIEQQLDRNVEPMDYIRALYEEVVQQDKSMAGVAKAASAVTESK